MECMHVRARVRVRRGPEQERDGGSAGVEEIPHSHALSSSSHSGAGAKLTRCTSISGVHRAVNERNEVEEEGEGEGGGEAI